MWGSIGVHHLWARPCSSSSVLRAWFVKLGEFSWWEAGGRIVGALWGAAARTCLILLTTFLCSCCLASSPAVFSAIKCYRYDRCMEETAFHFIGQFLLYNVPFEINCWWFWLKKWRCPWWWRCPWCNGCRCWKWTRRNEFKS